MISLCFIMIFLFLSHFYESSTKTFSINLPHEKTHKHMHLLSLAGEHKKTARCHHAASAVVVVVVADPYFRLSLPVAAATATIIIENVVPVAHYDDIAASLCVCVFVENVQTKNLALCAAFACFCSPTMKPWRSLLCDTHEHKHTNLNTHKHLENIANDTNNAFLLNRILNKLDYCKYWTSNCHISAHSSPCFSPFADGKTLHIHGRVFPIDIKLR